MWWRRATDDEEDELEDGRRLKIGETKRPPIAMGIGGERWIFFTYGNLGIGFGNDVVEMRWRREKRKRG